ncbi:hypothetical protein [Streptosporangium sp. CA-115845]|uniref:hypothetical protein n=1 Tax=Streptosporangium sp. CA-115845 TaxID=3240071 RepID=UPI003D8D0001
MPHEYQFRQGEDAPVFGGVRRALMPVLAVTIDIDNQPYTVWSPLHDPFITSAWVVAAPGTRIGDHTVEIATQYNQVTAAAHTEGCEFHSRGRATCDCGADTAWPEELRAPLKTAASALSEENRRIAKEREAAEAARVLEELEEESAWMREPGRITVGSGQGWCIWERKPNGSWHNTGEVVLPLASLEPYDAQFIEIVDEVIGLYSIRDPRTIADGEACP